MLKVLVPIDGSENSNRVARHVIKLAGELKELLEIHLLNVQHPFPGMTEWGVTEVVRQCHRLRQILAMPRRKVARMSASSWRRSGGMRMLIGFPMMSSAA